MKTQSFLAFATLVLAISLGSSSIAGQPQKKQSMKTPSIEGTYKLVSRTLPDGTTLKPPDINGFQTFTKTSRNFNIVVKDSNGKHFSYSVGSTYKLTASDFTETLLFGIMNDEIGGKGLTYTMKTETKTVPVKVEGDRLEVKLPFDPPAVVFEGNKMTATAEGAFTDYWEKVK